MLKRQEAVQEVITADPAVQGYSSFLGGRSALNAGRAYIALKPHAERDVSIYEVIARLRPKLAEIQGIKVFMQAGQDINVGGRRARAQFQYTLQDADLAELTEWAPRMLAKLSSLSELRDVSTDQQNQGGVLTLTINRDQAARYGITPQLIDDTLYDAFGQRQVAQYFTQLDTHRVVMEILPDLQGETETLERLYVKSPLSGQQVPLPPSRRGRRAGSSPSRSVTRASSRRSR